MPQTPYYQGEAVPQPSATARFIMWQSKPGEWLVVLADPLIAQVSWARKVPDGKFPSLMSAIHGKDGLLDIVRNPPPPPPPDGDDWIAPVALDMADAMNRAGGEAFERWNTGCPLGGGYEPPPELK